MGELDDPIVVDFPLRGEWMAVTTPARRIPSHGADVLGQRYAFDFVMPDRRPGVHLHPAGMLRSHLIGGRTRDCYGWGQPVHSMLDGTVTTVVDDVTERRWLHVIRGTALAIRNAITFEPTPSGARRLAGNHVIVGSGPTFTLFAHLAPDSITVREGQHVHAGDVLGRVGHTGNSTLPHLHVQLMDSADPLVAGGVPCAFTAYEAERDGRWVHVERGIPGWRERIRSLRP